jgi:uncharacterized protein YigE (DUF2233 family)
MRRLKIKGSILAIVLTVACSLWADDGGWKAQPSGFELYQGTIGGHLITATRLDPTRAEISILTPLHVLGDSTTSSSFSLEEVASKLQPLLAVNAGATASFQIPAPVGLLIEQHRESSPLGASAGGVVCVSDNGSVQIERVDVNAAGTKFSRCQYAVQARPMLIEDGSISSQVENRPGKPSNRTVVAVDEGQRLLFVVVRDIDIYSLASLLIQNKATFRIRSALNLDGSSSSGIMFRSGSSLTEFQKVGYTTSLIGSAILVKTIRGSSGNDAECKMRTVRLKSVEQFDIDKQSYFVYLASLPLKLPGRAELVVFSNVVWTGPMQNINRSALNERLKGLDAGSHVEPTIRSHRSATVSIGGKSVKITVDDSVNNGWSKVTLCPER